MAYRRFRGAVGGRGFLLMPMAAFVVHQLRYRLAYGTRADQVLAAQGHSYVTSLAPLLVALLALGLGMFALRVAHAGAGRADPRPHRSFAMLWGTASASLVAIYAAQEYLETLFAAGHPGGLAGIFGQGGWWAIAIAVLAGGVIAALLQAACRLVAAAGRLAARGEPFGRVLALRPVHLALAPRTPLADSAAGRAPPGR